MKQITVIIAFIFCTSTLADHSLPVEATPLFTEQYKRVRKRFLEKFVYTGEKVNYPAEIAEGIGIDGSRNYEKTIFFTDHGVYLGFALLTFAAESHILQQKNIHNGQTEAFIHKLLRQVDMLDTEGDRKHWGKDTPGFMVRNLIDDRDWRPKILWTTEKYNIKSDSELSLPGSKYYKPEEYNPNLNATSFDQIAHIFMGCRAVEKWSSSEENKKLSQKIVHRVIDRLIEQRFILKMPNGEEVSNNRGGDGRPLSGFLCSIADAFEGKPLMKPQAVTDKIVLTLYRNYLPEGRVDLMRDAENPLAKKLPLPAELARGLVDLWSLIFTGKTLTKRAQETEDKLRNYPSESIRQEIATALNTNVDFLILTLMNFTKEDLKEHETQAFAINLGLIAFALDTAVKDEALKKRAETFQHPFCVLLRSAIHDRTIYSQGELHNVSKLLTLCTKDGPKGYRKDNPFWFKDNRWVRCIDYSPSRDERETDQAIYNGLDFLALEVLLRILNSPFHIQPEIDLLFHHPEKLTYQAQNTITASHSFHLKANNKTKFTAQKEIRLLPGFTVEKDGDFHGKLEK
ncbi:3-coathanger stack domain-containing protein [Candidatus Uabimicrobium amorphum]|uniref:Uncharacterized protein n=1 Tax=Uabimicrobium amorphum TaxID=2596890 RepID=A0A5S9IQL4_UABAM|nr:3-coathanger stack domain-containing protein [Candidatus Uabimicrobium amorphum]BBM86293.1 hypothetical protein UABAM_04679 [Candidatus Uabimicrobium amorphum]